EAQPGDQDTLDAAAHGHRLQGAARSDARRGRSQLVDLDAVALEQRLIEGELERGPVRRVRDACRRSIQIQVGVVQSKADKAARRQRLFQARADGRALAVLEVVQEITA